MSIVSNLRHATLSSVLSTSKGRIRIERILKICALLSKVIAQNKQNTASPNKHEFKVKKIILLLSNEKRFLITYFSSVISNGCVPGYCNDASIKLNYLYKFIGFDCSQSSVYWCFKISLLSLLFNWWYNQMATNNIMAFVNIIEIFTFSWLFVN